MQMAAIVE